jgi:hypothetical protein
MEVLPKDLLQYIGRVTAEEGIGVAEPNQPTDHQQQ